MKTLTFFLVMLGLMSFAPSPKLTVLKLGTGLSVGVPAGFQPLPDDGIAAKYPSPRKPLAVFSNPTGRVDFSVSCIRARSNASTADASVTSVTVPETSAVCSVGGR